MGDVLEFFGVMMTLLLVGGMGYAMVIGLNYLGRKLKGATSDVVEELEHLRERVAELEANAHDTDPAGWSDRIQELEERVDFAERLLSRVPRDELPASTGDTPVTGS